ncbi:MAG: hypothetical protein K6G51_03070 [Sphaerochaetaceae bacterium]|nr:hypothetical protein [Sphaerochaetaceae bacterium]
MSFRNLSLTQPVLAQRLSGEYEGGLIPQCVLFAGLPYSGKMTAAVELAMTILKKEEAFSTLETNDLVIISNRDTAVRIKATIADFRKKRNKRSLEAMLFQLRVFLLSFHQSLIDAGDKSLFERASVLSDLLYEVKLDMDEKSLLGKLDEIEKQSFALLDKRGGKGLFSIDQIRSIQSYLMYDSSKDKCVILENIEDVTPGAMNSILKLLEEPPQGAHIILVSKNMGRILDTILSRVRKYHVPQINRETEKAFLRDNLFTSEYETIEDYYYSLSGFDLSQLKSEASSFLDSLLDKEDHLSSTFSSLCAFLEPYSAYDRFLYKVVEEIRERTIDGKLAPHEAQSLIDKISRCLNEAVTYNQNRRTMLERISKEVHGEQ